MSAQYIEDPGTGRPAPRRDAREPGGFECGLSADIGQAQPVYLPGLAVTPDHSGLAASKPVRPFQFIRVMMGEW
jgi:hypothetical protein